MEIEIMRREMLFLAPGQFWDLPDEIAGQMIARGTARAVDVPDDQVMEVKHKKEKGKEVRNR